MHVERRHRSVKMEVVHPNLCMRHPILQNQKLEHRCFCQLHTEEVLCVQNCDYLLKKLFQYICKKYFCANVKLARLAKRDGRRFEVRLTKRAT